MLELSIRRRQSNFSLSIFFASCKEKECYRDFSIGQVGFGSRSSLRVRPVYAMTSSESFFFFGAFSIFESGGITKHLMTGPSGNSEFCFPSTSVNIEGLEETKLTVSRGANHYVLNILSTHSIDSL